MRERNGKGRKRTGESGREGTIRLIALRGRYGRENEHTVRNVEFREVLLVRPDFDSRGFPRTGVTRHANKSWNSPKFACCTVKWHNEKTTRDPLLDTFSTYDYFTV